ncbi:T9SS type A sorting domain-containing protein [Lewinella sp. IMCC34183]|uniref:T9SS type A sorting domain-containing protein n=1 Tax=Lewinella sp. IMCC34183 TaxID=2248762 RepID=UPI000E23B0DA|nr:T9SS type A sorting domain-containing protein [Lewinella sp. IMCC34183]
MHKTITLFTAALLIAATAGLRAQDMPFIDAIYSVGDPTMDTYSQNIDVFELLRAGASDPNATPNRSLQMDVYQPMDDDESILRPVVVVFPTGNFLPRYVNRGLYGTRKDSAVVEIVNRVAERGYVGIAADYRVGWNPASPVQDVRTGSLLQAAYRGGQDAHALARYLRKTVAEEGNPYRIDTSRIVFWGLGTGGYVSMTHAFLDRIEEVEADGRFYDENDVPYVSLGVNSDPQGLMPAQFDADTPSNIPNHVGYNSTVAMSINSNGALGDIDWMEGKDDEPMVLGFHSPADIFAPFSYGDVIVPTTRDLVVGCVAGTEQIIEKANTLGLNDALAAVNGTSLDAMYGPLAQAVNVRNEAYKSQTRTLDPAPACPEQTAFEPTYELSHDNMYPFLSQGFGAPYNWVNEEAARAEIAQFNAAGGDLNADVAIGGEKQVNPNAVDPAAARRVIDTMMAVFIPRAYVGLDLGNLSTGTEDVITNAAVGLDVFPNPSAEGFTVRVAETQLIRQIDLFDLHGRRVAQYTDIDQSTYRVNRGNLPRGEYIVQLRLDAGTTAHVVYLR